MGYEWDEKKAEDNLRDHGVDFADAVHVLEDPFVRWREDPDFEEARYIALGSDASGHILVVSYTWRSDDIRIISARKASRGERRQYEEDI